MMDTADHFLCSRLARYWPNVSVACRPYQLDPYLLGALILTESSANPYAMRVERGFWVRYGATLMRRARLTATTDDDNWLLYPDVAAASYGLCQIMYPVAIEQGLKLAYPTELCDPQLNCDLGAKILGQRLKKNGGDVRDALLRYNGGAAAMYPETVLRWRDHLTKSPIDLDPTQTPQGTA